MLDALIETKKDDANEASPCLPRLPDFAHVPNTGPNVAMTITVREGVKEQIEAIARHLSRVGECEIKPHQVSIYAQKLFLAHYAEGTSGIERFVESPKRARGKIRIPGED